MVRGFVCHELISINSLINFLSPYNVNWIILIFRSCIGAFLIKLGQYWPAPMLRPIIERVQIESRLLMVVDRLSVPAAPLSVPANKFGALRRLPDSIHSRRAGNRRVVES